MSYYTTSKDYTELYRLVMEGEVIAVFLNGKLINQIRRGEYFTYIGKVRLSLIHDKDKFITECTRLDIEWVVGNKTKGK